MRAMSMALATTVLMAGAAAASGYDSAGPEDVWLMMQRPGTIVVDVSPAYDQGHLPGAVSAPLEVLGEAAADWDPEEAYVVYCHSEEASRQGATMLAEMGLEVTRLTGEYGGWVDAGYPVQVEGSYIDVLPGPAFDMIETNRSLRVLDVSGMYDRGHLPGAESVPLGTLEEAMADWDPELTYLVYCHGDPPSIQAAQMLVDAGFRMVYRLEGNYGAWVEADLPVDAE